MALGFADRPKTAFVNGSWCQGRLEIPFGRVGVAAMVRCSRQNLRKYLIYKDRGRHPSTERQP
jgi:hypothetical protein